jgi:hypothetical protein
MMSGAAVTIAIPRWSGPWNTVAGIAVNIRPIMPSMATTMTSGISRCHSGLGIGAVISGGASRITSPPGERGGAIRPAVRNPVWSWLCEVSGGGFGAHAPSLAVGMIGWTGRLTSSPGGQLRRTSSVSSWREVVAVLA